MYFKLLSLLAALPLALADLTITSPSGGEKLTAGSSLSVKFSGADDYATFQAFLIAGGNNPGTDSQVFVAGVQGAASGGSITVPLTAASIPGSGTTNAFYVRIFAFPSTGGQDIYYSNRFTVSGGGGSWPNQNMMAAAAAVASTPNSVPQNQKQAAAGNNGAAAAASGPTGEYAGKGDPHPTGTWLPYSMQTAGLTKYAPMQGKPGTAITQTATAPLFPTTAWSIFATFGPIPKQVTTILPSNNMFVVSSRENTAAAATESPKADDMAKFLARWKD